MILSRHATRRMQQRGYRQGDLELIMAIATETPDGLFLGKKETRREIDRLIRRIERLKRLQGTFIPTNGETGKSIYMAGRRKTREIQQGKRNKGMK